MRVDCNGFDELFEALDVATKVFEDALRVSTIRRPLDGKVYDATKVQVVVQASTVVLCEGDESQYLLEAGEICGIDYNDETQEKEGSKRAMELRAQLKAYADKRGWRILPGVIGI